MYNDFFHEKLLIIIAYTYNYGYIDTYNAVFCI